MSKRKKSLKQLIISSIFIIIILIFEYFYPEIIDVINSNLEEETKSTIYYNLEEIPEYKNEPYVIINDNIPSFKEKDYSTDSFENYSELDLLGRCGVAYANICRKIMPSDEDDRGNISSIIPTGWRQKAYDGLVDGDYLYNRCHLIGWQLAGENDNELNLITGTRYMNVEGMLQFENQIAEYLEKKESRNNHVLYRVTPVFEGNNLVASGVQLEAYSVEDNGKGVCFNVYVYNVQPGIIIDYETGNSWLEE